MDKNELIELMKHVANKMSDYGEIRTGGNLGTSILAMCVLNSSKELSKSIDKMTQVLEKLVDTHLDDKEFKEKCN